VSGLANQNPSGSYPPSYAIDDPYYVPARFSNGDHQLDCYALCQFPSFKYAVNTELVIRLDAAGPRCGPDNLNTSVARKYPRPFPTFLPAANCHEAHYSIWSLPLAACMRFGSENMHNPTRHLSCPSQRYTSPLLSGFAYHFGNPIAVADICAPMILVNLHIASYTF
jgi:hypothetical protein